MPLLPYATDEVRFFLLYTFLTLAISIVLVWTHAILSTASDFIVTISRCKRMATLESPHEHLGLSLVALAWLWSAFVSMQFTLNRQYFRAPL